MGASPSYLSLRDASGNQAQGLRLGVVTQVGYQFVWGPIAVAPRASMGHHWLLAELPALNDADVPHENGIEGVVSGFWLGIGLDLAIAF